MTEGVVSLYSDVKAEPVRWLWYPYIALGKITLLQGDPGDGKSSMMMQLIAEMTKGGKAPDGTSFGYPKRVIYQCSEDGVADTIKPRLIASGADCTIPARNSNCSKRRFCSTRHVDWWSGGEPWV